MENYLNFMIQVPFDFLMMESSFNSFVYTQTPSETVSKYIWWRKLCQDLRTGEIFRDNVINLRDGI